jgi:hypothetical protein
VKTPLSSVLLGQDASSLGGMAAHKNRALRTNGVAGSGLLPQANDGGIDDFAAVLERAKGVEHSTGPKANHHGRILGRHEKSTNVAPHQDHGLHGNPSAPRLSAVTAAHDDPTGLGPQRWAQDPAHALAAPGGAQDPLQAVRPLPVVNHLLDAEALLGAGHLAQAKGHAEAPDGSWGNQDGSLQRAFDISVAHWKAAGPELPSSVPHDVEDSLWTERTTISGKANAAKKHGKHDEPITAMQEAQDENQPRQEESKSSSSSSSSSSAAAWSTTVLGSSATERIDAVREVQKPPLTVAVDHLRSLLPEGGRILAANAHQVSLELPHQAGPMLLEVSLRAGVVDVRARGGAAAEMSWRVPELAAALQSAGVRLGSFEVAPLKKTGDTASADDGPAGDRPNSDDPHPTTRRSEPRNIVAAVAEAFTTP